MIRLAVRCRPEQADLVLAELVQLAPGGVEEESGPGWVEYAIYGAEGELPDLGDVEAAAGEGMVQVRSEPIPDDWADRWRDFHEPSVIAGGRVVIRPSWGENPFRDPVGPGREAEEPTGLGIDVVIDPGQAFGTGSHPTTRMCVELLLDLADGGLGTGALVDLGTGSAVLAIVAAKLGFAPVRGVDLEPAALEAAAANAAANGVEAEFARVNLREEPPPSATTIVANLTAPLLRDVATRLPLECERLVCSGLLGREREDVEAAFRVAGLTSREHREEGDWAALLLARAELRSPGGELERFRGRGAGAGGRGARVPGGASAQDDRHASPGRLAANQRHRGHAP
jgi:ribosomal protein L11 methyltransferase